MAKTRTIYSCSACGAEHPAWSGKCDSCGEWNTLSELQSETSSSRSSVVGASQKPVEFNEEINTSSKRLMTDIEEFDRVVGGGIMPGSVILLGGEPGIGKSTIALQLCGIKNMESAILYASGEESAQQVSGRVTRLGLSFDDVNFIAENDVDNIISTINKIKPGLVIIDSIQTVYTKEIASISGSISQVRDCAAKLIETAKRLNIPMILIGHVTKEGNVAGPKTLEHLVDTVLYLEGDRYHTFRVLRGMKNRFGSTNEVGIFEMKEQGLIEVKDPSGLFLQERQAGSTGSVVTSTLEGNRSFLLEIQGLATKTVFGYPKRTASGYDANRLQLLIAVLTKRANLRLGERDVYLNVVGGFRIKEPAVDLAVCMAVASSALNKPLDNQTIVLGEIGLSGEVRRVSQLEKRLKEASKLGFKRAVVSAGDDIQDMGDMKIKKVGTLSEAISGTL